MKQIKSTSNCCAILVLSSNELQAQDTKNTQKSLKIYKCKVNLPGL